MTTPSFCLGSPGQEEYPNNAIPLLSVNLGTTQTFSRWSTSSGSTPLAFRLALSVSVNRVVFVSIHSLLTNLKVSLGEAKRSRNRSGTLTACLAEAGGL